MCLFCNRDHYVRIYGDEDGVIFGGNSEAKKVSPELVLFSLSLDVTAYTSVLTVVQGNPSPVS